MGHPASATVTKNTGCALRTQIILSNAVATHALLCYHGRMGVRFILCFLLMTCVVCAGGVRVASLHPLLSEMARRVGGDDIVEVVDLFPSNAELHSFQPTGQEVMAAAGCPLLLACGKGTEPYLSSLQQSVGGKTRILELGKSIPDVSVPGSNVPDPHWWNSPRNMARASLALAEALAPLLPEAEIAALTQRQQKYAKEMEKLERTARLRLTRAPVAQRILVCSHAAMCHFCAAFGWEPIPVLGIAAESQGDMPSLVTLLKQLRTRGVTCLYTERRESPKFMQNLANSLGVPIRPLIMDGIAPDLNSYEAVFLFNINSIAKGFSDSGSSAP